MKIQALIGIPIALFGVKWLQQQVIDEKPEDIKPLIPEGMISDVPERPRQRDDGTFLGL